MDCLVVAEICDILIDLVLVFFWNGFQTTAICSVDVAVVGLATSSVIVVVGGPTASWDRSSGISISEDENKNCMIQALGHSWPSKLFMSIPAPLAE